MFGQDANFASSFENITDHELESHLEIQRYGDFSLTEAVRPAFDLKIVPRQGYAHGNFYDDETSENIPALRSAVSCEHLFEIFMELLDPLGPMVDMVLETSHETQGNGHQDLYRDEIDMPVLKSTLWDFEDLLVNDGCTGIAVFNANTPMEVQFDEHKMFTLYAYDLAPFKRIFADWNVRRRLERAKRRCDGVYHGRRAHSLHS